MRLFQLLIIPCLNVLTTVSWVKITKPTLIWEEMVETPRGERIFHCGEFDEKYTGRYHWRFNGSSILPEKTQIHRNQFTFLSGSNAIRNRLAGEYECCIRETLGNACYSRSILVKNKTSIFNVNMIGLNNLRAEEGSTYYLKLLDVKRIESVKCTQDGENMDNFKYPLLGKNSKKSIAYHLKIENIEKPGLVTCEIRVQNKEIVEKSFLIKFSDDSVSSSMNSSSRRLHVFEILRDRKARRLAEPPSYKKCMKVVIVPPPSYEESTRREHVIITIGDKITTV